MDAEIRHCARQDERPEDLCAIRHIADAVRAPVNLPPQPTPQDRWHKSRRDREAEYSQIILNIDRHNTGKAVHQPRMGLMVRVMRWLVS
jgi:hypothetical protein